MRGHVVRPPGLILIALCIIHVSAVTCIIAEDFVLETATVQVTQYARLNKIAFYIIHVTISNSYTISCAQSRGRYARRCLTYLLTNRS